MISTHQQKRKSLEDKLRSRILWQIHNLQQVVDHIYQQLLEVEPFVLGFAASERYKSVEVMREQVSEQLRGE